MKFRINHPKSLILFEKRAKGQGLVFIYVNLEW